jgi:biofilm PGA synthesis protein PgaA
MWTKRLKDEPLRRIADLGLLTASIALLPLFCAPVGAQTMNPRDAAEREAAIESARSGEYESALEVLELLSTTYPDDASLLHDRITVLAWSEDDTAVVALAERLTPREVPRYVQLAVAKSARNLQRYDLAERWYDATLEADATDIDALTGRLMSAGDARDPATVHAFIDAVPATVRGDTRIGLARAYALNAVDEYLGALRAYDDVLAGAPDNADALRGKIYALRSLLLPTQALELAAEHPGLLSESEIERLRADETAIQLRLGVRTPYPDETVAEATERPLERIDEQLQSFETESARNTLKLDQIVAFADANQAEAAIEAFEQLPSSVRRDQPYVLVAVSGAYMEAHRPEESLRLLDRALELDPSNLEARFQKIYALLDLDRYDDALAIVQQLNAELPMVNRAAGSNVIKPNESRLRAESMAGIAEAYGDQLAEAERRFNALLAEAPNNSEWRSELASVYRNRGWLERSLDEYRQVLTTDEELIAARLGQAHAQIDARDYESVDMTVKDLTATHGYDMSVQRLARRWQIHNDRELVITGSTGESSGPVAGTDSYSIDARGYSSPLGYHFRLFVATHDGYAAYAEGDARRRRIGTGVEYRSHRFTATALVSDSRDDGNTGFAANLSYRHSDFWNFAFGVEQNSDNVQLRAHRLGIEADRGFLTASFAPHELASISFGIDYADYSDGNVLETLFADGRRRIVNRPRSKLDATISLGFGRTETSAVPYYSPTKDRTARIGLEHRFRLYRRYDREVGQIFAVSAGEYAQQGFESGSIWSIRYGIDWTLSDRLSLGIEAQRHGQLFDGLREHATVGLVSVSGRF